MAVVPFPSTLPTAVSAALVDDDIDGPSKDFLRQLADADAADDARAIALQGLMEHLTTRHDDTEGDGDGDEDDMGTDWRLVPALVGIAALRQQAEQAALLVCAAHLEIGRLVMTEDDDQPVDRALTEARATALRLAGGALSSPIDDEAVLRPLLVVMAAFNGFADLALRLLNDDDEDDFSDEDEDEDEDEYKGDGDGDDDDSDEQH